MNWWCSCSSVTLTHRLHSCFVSIYGGTRQQLICLCSFISFSHRIMRKCHTWEMSSKFVELSTGKILSAYSTCGLFPDGVDSCIGHVITLITGLAYLVQAWTLMFLKESGDFKIQIRGIPVGNQLNAGIQDRFCLSTLAGLSYWWGCYWFIRVISGISRLDSVSQSSSLNLQEGDRLLGLCKMHYESWVIAYRSLIILHHCNMNHVR